jgi:hypothetical protein
MPPDVGSPPTACEMGTDGCVSAPCEDFANDATCLIITGADAQPGCPPGLERIPNGVCETDGSSCCARPSM